MKCIHCGSMWTASSGLSVSITNCPFCGKSLVPEKKALETVEAVLLEINRRFGISILTDDAKLVAYFSDLAPQLSKQRRILGYFVECGGPKKLAAVMNAPESEQLLCARQLIKDMKELMFIDEDAACMICDAFLFSVSGHHLAELNSVTVSVRTGEKQSDISSTPSGGTNSDRKRSRPRALAGAASLKDALSKLESIPNPGSAARALIEQYRTVLNSEGRYLQRNAQSAPSCFTAEYYVQNDYIVAAIDYSGFPGTFTNPGKVTCKTGPCNVVLIEADGINKSTSKSHKFIFKITGDTVYITGTGGFGQQTCKRDNG